MACLCLLWSVPNPQIIRKLSKAAVTRPVPAKISTTMHWSRAAPALQRSLMRPNCHFFLESWLAQDAVHGILYAHISATLSDTLHLPPHRCTCWSGSWSTAACCAHPYQHCLFQGETSGRRDLSPCKKKRLASFAFAFSSVACSLSRYFRAGATDGWQPLPQSTRHPNDSDCSGTNRRASPKGSWRTFFFFLWFGRSRSKARSLHEKKL